jgi:hypothetical protein
VYWIPWFQIFCLKLKSKAGKSLHRDRGWYWQKNPTVFGNINSKWFLRKLAHLFKGQFNYCASNWCKLSFKSITYHLEDNISKIIVPGRLRFLQ